MSISRPGSDETLGHVLVANGTMSQEQLDFALMLKDAQPDKYLGEILIQIGGMGGLRFKFGKNFSAEVEGQYTDEFSAGGMFTVSF
jgi:hypothetical protein